MKHHIFPFHKKKETSIQKGVKSGKNIFFKKNVFFWPNYFGLLTF